MKTETLLGLALLAGAAWWFLSGRNTAPALTSSQVRANQYRSIIGSLPPETTFADRQRLKAATDLGHGEGALTGLAAGAAFGPYGAGIGAGAGFVASFFV